MAYDEDLAQRIRELLASERGVTEQRMFGGLAFLVGGNMAVAASGQGGLLLHIDPDEGEDLIDGAGVAPMVMRGKAMQGWLRVDTSRLRTKRELQRWVSRGVTYARSLPAKKGRR
jgi:TfoX/Sxy family transcriptional regulator of competence genes